MTNLIVTGFLVLLVASFIVGVLVYIVERRMK